MPMSYREQAVKLVKEWHRKSVHISSPSHLDTTLACEIEAALDACVEECAKLHESINPACDHETYVTSWKLDGVRIHFRVRDLENSLNYLVRLARQAATRRPR